VSVSYKTTGLQERKRGELGEDVTKIRQEEGYEEREKRAKERQGRGRGRGKEQKGKKVRVQRRKSKEAGKSRG